MVVEEKGLCNKRELRCHVAVFQRPEALRKFGRQERFHWDRIEGGIEFGWAIGARLHVMGLLLLLVIPVWLCVLVVSFLVRLLCFVFA